MAGGGTFARSASDEQLSRAAKGWVERGYVSHTVAEARRLRDLLPRDKSVFTAAGDLADRRAEGGA